MQLSTKTLLFVCFILVYIVIPKSANAQAWYATNQATIDTLRKGDFQLKVVDEAGNPIGAKIKYKMIRHEFPWGTALSLGTSSDEDWYRPMARKYFNCGVFENAFKWSAMQPTQESLSYADVDRYLEWADEVGWELRGHALLWGSKNYNDFHPLQKWVKDLPVSEQLEQCELRVRREVEHYKGRIKEYDVMNEAIPGHANYLQTVVGDSINWNSFKWAREADPNAKLYINDYNVVSYNDTYKYDALITEMLNNGAPIDGIGAQCHFGGSLHAGTIKSKLDVLSKHGLPIKITEFDMQVGEKNMSERAQANYYAQAMRTFFAHPNVNGVMFWGFWDSRHWRDGAGIFKEDKTPKIAADSVYNLIHNIWFTEGETEISAGNAADINGYYGTYELEIEVEGETKVMEVPFFKENEEQEITVNLKDASLPSAKILSAELYEDKYIRVYFDTKVVADRWSHKGFSIFKGGKQTTLTSKQPEEDSTQVLILLQTKLDENDALTLSYEPGNIVGENEVPIKFTAPINVENKVAGFVSAETNIGGDTIILKMTQPLITPEASEGESFVVEADDKVIAVSTVSLDPLDASVLNLQLNTKASANQNITIVLNSANDLETIYGGSVSRINEQVVTNNVITSLKRTKTEKTFSVYYQQNNKQLVIENNTQSSQPIQIKLVDINGRSMYTEHVSLESRMFNVSHLPIGVYLLIDEESGYTKKILIQ